MRKTLLLAATAAATLAAVPAQARDGQPYFGVSGGVLFPKDQDVDIIVDPALAGPTVTYEDAVGIDYKRGYDVDVNLGYDFGIFRLEGELGYKRAKLDNIELSGPALTALQTEFGSTFDPETDFELDGRTSVLSGMVNGLVDLGGDGFGVFAGGGIGRARVKFAGARDDAWAYQLLAGVRAPVSDNIDIGLKYRYFRTGKLAFLGAEDGAIFSDVDSSAFANAENRFRSHSLLASLTFNFGGAAPVAEPAPPPPAVEVAAPPPPPPATQTCPDGSVVLATDTCPVPPPPPPPPPPAPVRG